MPPLARSGRVVPETMQPPATYLNHASREQNSRGYGPSLARVCQSKQNRHRWSSIASATRASSKIAVMLSPHLVEYSAWQMSLNEKENFDEFHTNTNLPFIARPWRHLIPGARPAGLRGRCCAWAKGCGHFHTRYSSSAYHGRSRYPAKSP